MRLAATVMLVRPAPLGFDLFMVRRSEASHFVPNAYVFPGGTVLESDLSDRALARTHFADPASSLDFHVQRAAGLADVPLATEHEAAGLFFAAVRELAEEAGVLLARDRSGHKTRAELESRGDFLEFLERSDLFADASALTLFSQWLTPASLPKRYNTHFFLALAGSDVVAAADAHETHDGIWIAPGDALVKYAAGDLQLVYPTIKHLERLAAFDTADALFAFARTKPIVAITPNARGERFELPPELEGAW